MDLTWAAIGKIMLAGLGTYILLPAFLVIRDAVLWKAINKWILNGKLQTDVRRYVELVHEWNTEHAGNKRISNDGDETKYTIKGKEVTADKWRQHTARSDELRKQLSTLKTDINRKAVFLKWLLKHYQQESVDPINEWKKEEEQRVAQKFQKKS